MKSLSFGCLICSIMLVSHTAVFSQESKNWDFEIAPFYLWAISIDGDMGIRGGTNNVSIGFDDIWDNLEGVFTLRINTLYRKKFGLYADYNYLDLGTERADENVNLEVSFKAQILNVGGSYRLMDGSHTLDGTLGIRYIILDARIDLRNVDARLDGDESWVDPTVGLRYNYQISEQWAIRLYGDIGGFGAASDFTWQGLGLIDYQPWKNVAIVAGYRAIGTDYESGSGADKFIYDTTVHGPVIGLDIRF